MRLLLQALKTRITAAALAPAGGVWLGMAPAGTPFPFLTLTVIGPFGPPEYNSGPAYVDIIPVSFDVFGTDGPALEKYMEGLEEKLAPRPFRNPLHLDRGKHLTTLRGGKDFFEEPDRAPDGKIVFHGLEIFEFRIGKKVGA